VQLHTLSLPQFIERVQQVSEAEVARDVSRVREMKLPMSGVTADDLPINSRYYLAMLDLMREEQLDALAVQCWPELPNVVGQWPYLAFARLSDEGHAIALEGDVDGALTCLIAKMLGMGVGFITDWLEHDASTIAFWHPGNAPPQLCNPCGSAGGPSLGVHFNINKPLVVDAMLKSDVPMTIARLWRCDGRYHLTAFEGRTIPMRRKLTGNTALVEVANKDVYDWFDELAHAGMPHHVVIFAGHHQETLRRLARMMRIDWMQ
jgi:L-fucose isomerase-like protein